MRMAIISASFPWKAQVEEFQKKLQFRSLTELFQDSSSVPTFIGLAVRRVELEPNGKPKVKKDGAIDWENIDLERELRKIVLVTGRRFEPEDPKLKEVSFAEPLLWRRPIQFHTGRYPTPEKNLPGIQATLDKALALNPQFTPKNPFADDGASVFGSDTPSGTAGGAGTTGPGGASGPGGMSAPGGASGPGGVSGPGGGDTGSSGAVGQLQQQQIPEFCLVRFIDVTVRPGKSYNYELQVRMKNPNYKNPNVAWAQLAEKEEVRSPWVLVKDNSDPNKPESEQARVTIDPEAFVYAVDQAAETPREYTGTRDRIDRTNQTVVQIHRWMAWVRPKADDVSSQLPVGDWMVGERLIVTRGEYLSRQAPTEVPIWIMLDQRFGLRIFQKDKKVPVTFSMDTGDGDLLVVDFQGGDLQHSRVSGVTEDPNTGAKKFNYDVARDKAATELMLMSPTGKLLVHNGVRDADDQVRKERYGAWKTRIKAIKDGDKSVTQPSTDPFGKPNGPNDK
jgi:hypothetical protein